jgi:hypothetical protein
MADKKISELTAAGALDGTELVPIVQGGETVRTTVALIAGEAAPGAPRYALQFNNPLGTFDGDADALWEPAAGMTLGGATEAAGVVTPGANDIALAVGNYAVPGFVTLYPGDPIDETTNAVDAALLVNNYFSGASLSSVLYNVANVSAIRNTGASPITAYGEYVDVIATADNDTTITQLIGSSSSAAAFGDDVSSILGVIGGATYWGTTNPSSMYGLLYNTSHYGSGDITDVYGLTVYNYFAGSGGATDAYTAYLGAFTNDGSGTVTNNYGLYIEDHVAGTNNYNIMSKGATSLNVFEGNVKIDKYIEQTEMTAPAAPAANGVRIYAVDNGAGKTQLMAIFSSGAAQQLAIQP